MCETFELGIFDGLIVIAVILLIVWILALCGVFTIDSGSLEHSFIVLAIIFIIAWILTRFCYGRRRVGYGERRITV